MYVDVNQNLGMRYLHKRGGWEWFMSRIKWCQWWIVQMLPNSYDDDDDISVWWVMSEIDINIMLINDDEWWLWMIMVNQWSMNHDKWWMILLWMKMMYDARMLMNLIMHWLWIWNVMFWALNFFNEFYQWMIEVVW